MNTNTLKGLGVGIILAAVIAIAGYFYVKDTTMKAVNNEWRLKLSAATQKIDSLRSVPAKIDSFPFYVQVQPSRVDYSVKVDSAFSTGYQHGVDSLRALFDFVAQPFDTTHIFESGDTVRAAYVPLMHAGFLSEHPKPMLTMVDSIFVQVPLPPIQEAWYIKPAWLTVGIAVGIIIKTIW